MRSLNGRMTVGIAVIALGALVVEPAFGVASLRFLQRLILEPVIVSLISTGAGLLAGLKMRARRLRPCIELRDAMKTAYRQLLSAYSERTT